MLFGNIKVRNSGRIYIDSKELFHRVTICNVAPLFPKSIYELVDYQKEGDRIYFTDNAINYIFNGNN